MEKLYGKSWRLCCRSNREIIISYEEVFVEFEPISNKFLETFIPFQTILAINCSFFINNQKFLIFNMKNFSQVVIFVQIWVIQWEKNEEELNHGVWFRNFIGYYPQCSFELRFLKIIPELDKKKQLKTKIKGSKWKISCEFDYFLFYLLENYD